MVGDKPDILPPDSGRPGSLRLGRKEQCLWALTGHTYIRYRRIVVVVGAGLNSYVRLASNGQSGPLLNGGRGGQGSSLVRAYALSPSAVHWRSICS